MANRLYTKAAEKMLQGQINWLTGNLKISAVKNTYVENLDTDEFYTSISAHIAGVDQALAGKSIVGGKFDANDPVWAAVTAGDTIECFVIWLDTGVAGTSSLLARLDQVTSLPFLTNGGNIEPKFDNGANKIFSLVP